MASGITISIDPVIMQQAVQTIDSQQSVIESCLNSIQRDADALKSLWEGESANAYQATMTKLGENSPKIVSILKEYVLDLNQISSQFMSEEQRRAINNEALPSDIFGV